MSKKPVVLVIRDGWGRNPLGPDVAKEYGDATVLADTPFTDYLLANYPHSLLGASGEDVGLPDGQMGNSEVGHLNLGAGRVVYQDLCRVDNAIKDGSMGENAVLKTAFSQAVSSRLHLLGLVSDGGVHSHNTHIYALLELAKRHGLADRVFVHALMDGRDVPPTSGKHYIEQMEAKMAEIGAGKIASIAGRYWTMDRDKRWERVERGYNALMGEGKEAECPVTAMQASYDAGVTDEFVEPTVIVKDGKPVATIEAGDSVIFFNFRPDRAREITRALIDPEFDGFARKGGYKPVTYVSMTQYDATFTNLDIAFKPQTLDNTLGEYLSKNGIAQLRIAETEKYAHVTFFFNGGVEAPNPGEDRALIPSPKVATYDLKPEMSAYEVTEEAVKRIQSGKYGAMILNFANCDMVGHTGVMEAAEKAVKTVDECVGRVVDAILAMGGKAIVTADHGNADQMIDPETGDPFTAHTTNPVPIIVIDPAAPKKQLRSDGRLCDLAPTMLELMGLAKPAEMTGESLIVG